MPERLRGANAGRQCRAESRPTTRSISSLTAETTMIGTSLRSRSFRHTAKRRVGQTEVEEDNVGNPRCERLGAGSRARVGEALAAKPTLERRCNRVVVFDKEDVHR